MSGHAHCMRGIAKHHLLLEGCHHLRVYRCLSWSTRMHGLHRLHHLRMRDTHQRKLRAGNYLRLYWLAAGLHHLSSVFVPVIPDGLQEFLALFKSTVDRIWIASAIRGYYDLTSCSFTDSNLIFKCSGSSSLGSTPRPLKKTLAPLSR